MARLAHKRDVQHPFFGFLFYDAPHSYSNQTTTATHSNQIGKRRIRWLWGPDFDKTPYLNRYRNAVHFVDEQLKKVFDDLQEKGLMDDTVVIITADHGEELQR